ncbi:MAG TPA: hypothetical protein VEX37_13240, partial [Thermomicrobiales bacterium]|nr:hypothetical protein [Thermomicrobiales bacterium]
QHVQPGHASANDDRVKLARFQRLISLVAHLIALRVLARMSLTAPLNAASSDVSSRRGAFQRSA